MSRSIRLLIADIDGTVVTKKKQVTARTRRAIQQLREAGIQFSITSGRPPRGLVSIAEDLELTTPMSAFNGGVIVRPDLEVMVQRTIPLAVAEEVVDYLESAGCLVWVYRAFDWFVTTMAHPRMEKEQFNVQFAPTVVPDLRQVLDGAVKITGYSGDAMLLARCEAELRERVAEFCSATRSQPYYLDVTDTEANKGAVVHANSRFLRIPIDEIAVIGDMANDVLMFGVAGTSIAMGNSHPEVKRAARYVTTSNEDEGFANAVDWFVLRNRPSSDSHATLGLPSRARACVFGVDDVLAPAEGGGPRVRAIEGSLRYLRALREAGLRTAVVCGSHEEDEHLTASGLGELFDARIGDDRAIKDHLAGMPSPDRLIAACTALGVDPRQSVVFESDIPGVEAGRAGHFGYVVGVARNGQAAELRLHGADAVIPDLAAMLETPVGIGAFPA